MADGEERPVAILGISCDLHDAAAAILVDGVVVAAAEEERFTRRTHDGSLPVNAVASCLEVAGITADLLDHVVFYEKPLVGASRFVAARRRQGPSGLGSFVRSSPGVLGRNLMIGPRVAVMLRRLGAAHPPRLSFVEHHRSHAAAAFLASPHDHAAILTVDGLGEWTTATIAAGAHQRIRILEEQRFPHSIGLVYSFLTAYCGFTPNSDEYKVMGLAAYGRPRFQDALAELVSVGPGGALRVDGSGFGWFGGRGLDRPALARLFDGPPRQPGGPVTPREADLAASVQLLTEQAVLEMARRAHDLTGEDVLCMAGGVALNSVANGRLLREGPFREVWVQPAAGDAGSAIGAALSLWHEHLGNQRTSHGVDAMRGARLGPSITADVATSELARLGVGHRLEPDEQDLADRVADRLAQGQVVAWVQGAMEFGPRALGGRSLLGDPRDPDLRERLNLQVKGRESFRPFAPAVLADEAAAWFEIEGPSPYMLVVAPVRPEHLVPVADEPTAIADRTRVVRSTIPACTHVDGSARVQTVSAEQAPELHRLLMAFHRRTGCPMLVNTSFNRAGEPIVATVEQAVRSGAAGGVDLLVIGSILIEGDELAAWAIAQEAS